MTTVMAGDETGSEVKLGVPHGLKISESTASRISMPRHVDWHMILDHELDKLGSSSIGTLGSLGFAALGASVGFIPQILAIWARIGSAAFDGSDAITLVVFGVSVAAASICLMVYALNRSNFKSVVRGIRARPKL